MLFERTSRAVRLAPAGELLLPRARGILAEVDDARDALAALAGVLTGRLRLGVVGSTGRAAPAVEQALAAFHRRHPGVQIAVEDTGSRPWPSRFARGRWTSRSSACSPTRSPTTSRTGCSPSSRWSPSSRGITRSPAAAGSASAELADGADFVEMRAESGLRTQVDAAFARAGVPRDGRLRPRHLGRGGALRRAGARRRRRAGVDRRGHGRARRRRRAAARRPARPATR